MAIDHQKLHSLLGKASRHLQKERFPEAARLCKKAIAIAPDSPDAHMLMAGALEGLGERVEAIGEYRKAIEADPKHLASYVNLGVLQKEMSNYISAIDAFQRAVAVDPNNLTARYNLARALFDNNFHQGAIDEFLQVLRLRPDWTEVMLNIGEAYMRHQRFDEAIKWYEKSLTSDGDRPTAYVGLGWAYQAMGDFETSEKYLRQALEINPLVGRAYQALTVVPQSEEQADADLKGILAALNSGANISQSQISSHNIAAYRILNRKKMYSDAFGHLAEANRIRFEQFPPEGVLRNMRHYYSSAQEYLTKEFFDSHLGNGNPSDAHVFVVGMPRSGTTLTEQIISSHPDAAGVGELSAMSEIRSALPKNLERPFEFPRQAAALSSDDLTRLSHVYLKAFPPGVAGARRVVDKSLMNAFHIGMIKLIFPKSKFILCHRDPMDVCWSCYSTGFGAGLVRYAVDFNTVAEAYRLNVDMMAYWNKIFPEDTMVLHYEDLIADFEPKARSIIDFAGLEWDEACLAFHETERSIATSSVWQVRQPIYKSSVGKWKPYEEFLGPLREALGDYITSDEDRQPASVAF